MKRSRPQWRPATLPVLVLAGLLLCAQASTIEHSVDHLFHDAQELCKGFIGFEKSSSITNVVIPNSEDRFIVAHNTSCDSGHIDSVVIHYPARAPPAPI